MLLRGIGFRDRVGGRESIAVVRDIGDQREPLARHHQTQVQREDPLLPVQRHRAALDFGFKRNGRVEELRRHRLPDGTWSDA